MSPDALVDFLRSTPLLREIPDDALAWISRTMVTVEMAEGAVLFEEGAEGDTAWLILEGEVVLSAGGVELLRRGPGDFIGEFALIDDRPRSTSGTARSRLRLLAWDRPAFQAVLASDPAVAGAILRTLTAKLRTDVTLGVGLITERKRLQEDLARSRQIQTAMLPPERVDLPGLQVAGRCAPVGMVGGDFYDVLHFDDGRSAIVMADVTGHGFHSGLIVAMAKSCLHAQARFDASPPAMMHAMRHTLSLSLERGMLMSCAYLLFDPAGGRVTYANAGHPHPLRRSPAGGVMPLDVLDPILGSQDVDEIRYRERQASWCPGDAVVLYSDGVSEARSPGGEEFGRRRLEAALESVPGSGALDIRDALLAAVETHGAGAPVHDDFTLVVACATHAP